MQGENNREPTDARKADMILRGHMLSLCSPQWPPALLQITDHVAYGGYPEDRRSVSQGDRPEKMTADLVSFRGTPNGCSETNVSLQMDRAKLTWLPNVREPLKDDANFSGMSGGPCFRLIPAENRIQLAAIIYEGRWDIGIVFARPTTLISDEGIVAAAPTGVNRPEPEATKPTCAGDRLELFDPRGTRLAAFSAGIQASGSPQSQLAGTSWQLVKFQGSDDTTLTPDDRTKYTIEFATA